MSQKKQCVILGGGLAGLAMGALVGGQDYDVTILESQPWLGGKCRRLTFDCGSYIDSGPSIFTFPTIWDRFLTQWKHLSQVNNHDSWDLKLERYSGLGMYAFDDQMIDLSDPHHELHNSWRDYVKKHKNSSKLLSQLTFTDPKSPKAFQAGLKLFTAHGMKTNYKSYVKKLNLSSRLKEIISIHALNTGSTPDSLPAFFASLAAGLDEQGVWYPQGGVYEIITTLKKMNTQVGNKIYCSSKVASISGRSVQTETSTFHADLIINSLDFERFNHLSAIKSPTLNTPLTASALALYARLSSPPKGLKKIEDEHVVMMPDDCESFFSAMLKGQIYDKPMSFVSFHPKASKVYPSNHSPMLAIITTMPPNGANYPIDTPLLMSEIDRLGRLVGEPNLRQFIDDYYVLDPAYFSQWGAKGGAIYGRSLPPRKAGPFHPLSYQDRHMKHVWHIGASVHPGGGIPAILGGVMIAREKLEESGYLHQTT